MSDFLSNFDKKNYDNTLSERDKEKEKEASAKQTKPQATKPKVIEKSAEQKLQSEKQEYYAEAAKEQIAENSNQKEENFVEKRQRFDDAEYVEIAEEIAEEEPAMESEPVAEVAPVTAVQSRRDSNEEETEVDPTFKKRRQMKIILFSVIGVLVLVGGFFTYYQLTHVKMPEFEGKQVSEARKWATENKVTAEVKQEYSMEFEANEVMKQSVAKDKKVKKGSTVSFTTSLGADPDANIPLPDFSKMNETSANEWVKQNKAENLSVMKEYSDTVEKGQFIRQEISDKEVTPESYRRKDRGIVYYSKGKETFEKNITVPDFTNKAKAEVETWVKTNAINMTYEEADSDTVEAGMIISQSIAKDQKVAKKDEMKVVVSTGKAVVVPNFAGFTSETAATAVEGLVVTVKTEYGSGSYGQLLSQSVPAGTKLNLKDTKNVTVVYSLGQPYLKSVIGSLEGDLPKTFYDEYQSKGANVRYTTYAVNSAEIRGTVVEMSAYNQYVGLNYTVSIGISNGAFYDPNAAPAGGGSSSGGQQEPQP